MTHKICTVKIGKESLDDVQKTIKESFPNIKITVKNFTK